MTVWLWVGFVAFILLMLGLDLGALSRRSHEARVRKALASTGACVGLALAFNVAVYFIYDRHWLGIGLPSSPGGETLGGRAAALRFFSGWLVEYSLSIDNIFVIAAIFAYFRVPREHQHRVLFWGVLGALLLRGAMIAGGVALIARFQWTTYFFAGFLLFTAARMLVFGDKEPHPERSPVLRAMRRVLRISPALEGQRFFTRRDGRWAVTPLFLVLLAVETTDVIFAVDSVPAVIGITRDPFLVYTSNIFAILGLRSLYSVFAAAIDRFRYLKVAVVLVLVFVSIKMLLEGTPLAVPAGLSLGVIGVLLGAGIIASELAVRLRKPTAEMLQK